jgi:hypothetical protein
MQRPLWKTNAAAKTLAGVRQAFSTAAAVQTKQAPATNSRNQNCYNEAQRKILQAHFLYDELRHKNREDYEAIAREIDGLSGGRRVKTKAVVKVNLLFICFFKLIASLRACVHAYRNRHSCYTFGGAQWFWTKRKERRGAGTERVQHKNRNTDDEEVDTEERMSWVGKTVRKVFGGYGEFSGTITQYGSETDTFKVAQGLIH